MSSTNDDFAYLSDRSVYFDAACQSLRPQAVIDAMTNYYQRYNSCGDRVKYDWGTQVDAKVAETRRQILARLNLSARKYFVSFTLNTTYGLNLLLGQLQPTGINQVVTSDIEHNSVFLSTLSFSQKHHLPRRVLARNDDGSLDLAKADLSKALVVVNAVSNIDSRQLTNIKQVAKAVHEQGGLLIIDAAQAMTNYVSLLSGVEADAICFSSHKMYGPSLGAIVCRKSLLKQIEVSFIGGGMVSDVQKDSFELLANQSDEDYTVFEPGLQLYGEIIGLGAALDWLPRAEKNSHLDNYAHQLIDFLTSSPDIHMLNHCSGTTIAFYHDKYDSHLLAEALSEQGIMARSGYFCAHYYLKNIMEYPSLLRLSLGLHNRQSDLDKFIGAMKGVFGK